MQTDELKAKWFKRDDDSKEPLASQLTCVRLTKSVHAAIQVLPSKSAWLRRVIGEAARRELMINTSEPEPAISALQPEKPARKGKNVR